MQGNLSLFDSNGLAKNLFLLRENYGIERSFPFSSVLSAGSR